MIEVTDNVEEKYKQDWTERDHRQGIAQGDAAV